MKLFRTLWSWLSIGGSLVVLSLIWGAYRFNWPGTGFQGKTLWDWLSLLIVPLALALIALFFSQANTRTERRITDQRNKQDQEIAEKRYEQDQEIVKQRYEQDKEIAEKRYEQDQLLTEQRYKQDLAIAKDKQREDLLQTYFDRMSELLLEKGLRTSQTDAEVRNVARTRTISVLRQLDARRVQDVFAFLRDAGLNRTPDPIINLQRADLSSVNWSGVVLIGFNLSGVNLSNANLSNAHLNRINLKEASLREADLSKASLREAKVSEANFRGANLRGASFYAAICRGTIFDKADRTEADFDGAEITPPHYKRTGKLTNRLEEHVTGKLEELE